MRGGVVRITDLQRTVSAKGVIYCSSSAATTVQCLPLGTPHLPTSATLAQLGTSLPTTRLCDVMLRSGESADGRLLKLQGRIVSVLWAKFKWTCPQCHSSLIPCRALPCPPTGASSDAGVDSTDSPAPPDATVSRCRFGCVGIAPKWEAEASVVMDDGSAQGALFCDGLVCAAALGMHEAEVHNWLRTAWVVGPLEWKREFGHTSVARVPATGKPDGCIDERPTKRRRLALFSTRREAMAALNAQLMGGALGCAALRDVSVFARPFVTKRSPAPAAAAAASAADCPPAPLPPVTCFISLDGVQVSTRVRGKLRLRAHGIAPVDHTAALRDRLAGLGV